jgi:hypothetical protein
MNNQNLNPQLQNQQQQQQQFIDPFDFTGSSIPSNSVTQNTNQNSNNRNPQQTTNQYQNNNGDDFDFSEISNPQEQPRRVDNNINTNNNVSNNQQKVSSNFEEIFDFSQNIQPTQSHNQQQPNSNINNINITNIHLENNKYPQNTQSNTEPKKNVDDLLSMLNKATLNDNQYHQGQGQHSGFNQGFPQQFPQQGQIDPNQFAMMFQNPQFMRVMQQMMQGQGMQPPFNMQPGYFPQGQGNNSYQGNQGFVPSVGNNMSSNLQGIDFSGGVSTSADFNHSHQKSTTESTNKVSKFIIIHKYIEG